MKMKKFTFIKLLAVIAITSLLVTILISSLNKMRDRSFMAVCLSNQKQAYAALRAFAVQSNNHYPRLEFFFGKTFWSQTLKDGWFLPVSAVGEENHVFSCSKLPWKISGTDLDKWYTYGMIAYNN